MSLCELDLNLTSPSKFFTVVVTLNAIGLILAAANVWTYPRHYTGAFILGNLLTAILVRNELFGRFLYLVINTCFAKVRLAPVVVCIITTNCWFIVDSPLVALGMHLCATTSRRYSQRLCDLWLRLDHIPCCVNLHQPQEHSRRHSHHWSDHEYLHLHFHS